MINSPWVEKYRPNIFENILFNDNNYGILKNMLEQNSINNLLFVGPPGTGKTTTIINFINKYNKLYYNDTNINLIHLNASDDRGIDIIRNHIYLFITNNNYNNDKIKFVVLDEIDCMTRYAQIALKTLIQNSDNSVMFCLICNYISKIEECLLNQVIQIKFYDINKEKINKHLNYILKSENIINKDIHLNNLIDYYGNDIRSMVNYLQINYSIIDNKIDEKIITQKVYIELFRINLYKNLDIFKNKLNQYSRVYNEDRYNILYNYIYFVLINYIHEKTKINSIKFNNFINDIELFLHKNSDIKILISYIYKLVKNYIKEN